MSLGIFHFLIVTLTNHCVVFCLFFKGATTVHRVEEVTPTVLFSKGNGEFPHRIVYMVAAKEKSFVLSLRRNTDLLPDNFRLDFGNGKSSRPEKQGTQCYYQGRLKSLEGKKRRSRVTVSTCGGLHGVFEDDDCIYYIAPRNFSEGFREDGQHPHNPARRGKTPHYLYNMTEITGENSCKMNCKSSDGEFLAGIRERIQQQGQRRYKREVSMNDTNLIGFRSDLAKETKYIELYLVNDYSMYLHYGKNSTFLEQRSKLIANILDARFRPLKVRIVLVGVEVWTSKNRVRVVDDSMQSLLNFLQYRARYINRKYRNDNAQLITRNTFDKGTTAGKAPISTICSWRYSGGVNQDTHDNPLYVATVIAHELGHNLGMHHDSKEPCTCTDHAEKKCIMSHALDASVRSFSSCSRKYLTKTLINGQGHCLFDFPRDKRLLPTCGNGIVEKGEECDCGTAENCKQTDKCCNPDTCMLREGATCREGECCQDCQYIKGGTMCRDKTSDCDLPEYCTGYSKECPNDVHLHNGYPCSNNTAYCYNGSCLSHNLQCQNHYGNSSRVSHSACYPVLNARGNREGNCGKKGHRFKRCTAKHSMCGTLQCNSILQRSAFTKRNRYINCLMGHSNRNALTNKNNTLVKNGTKCGDGRVCLNQKCVRWKLFQAFFDMKDCPLNCSGHGVCNSNKNCHCDDGWSPPHCDRPGYGGSIDSGQPMSLRKYRKKAKKRLKDIGKPVIAIITVGLVCAIVFALAVTKFSFRRICRTVTKREQERNRAPRGELRDVLEQH